MTPPVSIEGNMQISVWWHLSKGALCQQMVGMTCFIWGPAALWQAGAVRLGLMAGKRLHRSSDFMLTMSDLCTIKTVASRSNLTLNEPRMHRCQEREESVQVRLPSSSTLASVVFGPVRFVTLTPGDVFLTGTPPGVGVFREPPVYLKVISQVQRANSKALISE